MTNKDISNILELPLKSQYRALTFTGLADGSLLTPDFNIQDLQNKIFVLKSFKIINYYSDDAIDISLTDGANTFNETIPADYRIDRLFDRSFDSTGIKFSINGTPINIFSQTNGLGSYPADLDLDNIFFKYDSPLIDLNIQIWTVVLGDIETPTNQIPTVKVLVECYLI